VDLGRAVGRSDDFYAFGYSPELDDWVSGKDPQHDGSFTFVFRFQEGVRSTVGRVKVRLDGLWQPPRGPILAAGHPGGIVQIDASGLTEVALPQLANVAFSIWGTDNEHVFVCGGALKPFVIYREHGQWRQLALPAGTERILNGCGQDENEVYFVGDGGQIHLWDGRQISRLPSPTTRDLVGLARLNDKYMCACGYGGTLLMGNKQAWRIVPTNTNTELLSLAELDGKVYFGAEDVTWSFDGQSSPVKAIDARSRVLSGLSDGLLLARFEKAKLWSGGVVTDLDTVIT
jgi:hypothetical protein